DFTRAITASGEKGNTVTISGTTYATANENEDVNVGVTLDADSEVLEGVYYNAGDESTLTKAEDLRKGEGGFLMKMLRGGAMLLGLKVHTHVYTYTYNNDATCTADGTETGHCACGKVGPTRTKAGSALGHDYNYVSDGNATCTADATMTGTCSRCGATNTLTDFGSALGHMPGFVYDENVVPATADKEGSREEVVYCDRCGAELSRVTKVIPKLDKAKVTYTVVTAAEFRGVKLADQPAAEEALAAFGKALDEEGAKIGIPALAELLTEAQKAAFDKLSAADKLQLVLCLLGYSDNKSALSEDAAKLLDTLAADIDAAKLAAQFPTAEIQVNGTAAKSFAIEVTVEKDGSTTLERYTFFQADGQWKLFQVETGVYA
ncbi:MAG: hypothetical protein IK099_14345, partial [Clostridia bacterium]|nr:hypothetical protein [Clostridia bacterium]